MVASDFRINSKIRQVLSRHWIDLQELHYGCFRGTVRFTGKLCHLNRNSLYDESRGLVEMLESEVRRITGVRAVFFDLLNWQRNATGSWVPLEESSGPPVSEEQSVVLTDISVESPNPTVDEG